MNAAHNTGDGASARNVTTVSDQTGTVAATKAVTTDARRGTGGEEFGTRIEARHAAASDIDADARTERTVKGYPFWKKNRVLVSINPLGRYETVTVTSSTQYSPSIWGPIIV